MPADIVIYKIKHGKEKKLKAWYQEIASKRSQEALETIREEHIKRELATIIKIGESFYDVGLVEYDQEMLPADVPKEINQKHRQIRRECLEKPAMIGKPLYDLVDPSPKR